uniref:Nucleolar protein 10 n=1 Tax=Caenorhabditis brenneri TaxID=135651 RepID=B6VBL0_CAEBE|nr:hypothetical protein Cbre_JD13.005 [Caenorhabditis brenneri]
MFLRYYLDDKQQRIYTLKRTSPSGEQTLTAHPARFSPEDKNSKYRIIIKKRFGLLPTQKISRRRIIVSFVLFFVGWKAFGYTLNDMFLWTVDEQTMQGRFLTPQEGKERREALERQRDPKLRIVAPPIVSKYDLDD